MNMFRTFVYLISIALAGPLFADTSMAAVDADHSQRIKLVDSPITETLLLASADKGLFGWQEQHSEKIATLIFSSSPSAMDSSKKLKNITASVIEGNTKQNEPMTPNALLSAVPNARLGFTERATSKLGPIKEVLKVSDTATTSWFPATPNAKVAVSPNMVR